MKELESRNVYLQFEEKKTMLNQTWIDYEDALVKMIARNGYVLAVHSSKYGKLEQGKLFDGLFEYIETQYPKSKFISGTYSHENTTAIISLSDYNDALVKSYKGAWISAGFPKDILGTAKPCIQFSTCDTGIFCATVYPFFISDDRYYMLGEKLAVKHWAKNGVEQVQKMLPKAFSAMKDGFDNIANLIYIKIDYPVATLIRAVTEVNFIIYSR